MAVTHVSTNSDFAAAATVTTPSGTTGDLIVYVGAGYGPSNPPDDPYMTNSASTTDFTQIFHDDATPTWTAMEIRTRVTDGTEDASYSPAMSDHDSYGEFAALVRITEGVLQSTSGGIYFSDGDVDGESEIPAHTVDEDGSLAVIFAIGYENSFTNGDFTGAGYTQRAAQDGTAFVAYTKEVDAGSPTAVTAVQGGSDQGGMLVLLIFGPSLSTEIEGFRFEKDHASEGGDWWAAQDTNPTGVDGAFGLRVATVFSGDPGSASFKIAGYRRVGDTFWDGPPT